MFGVRTSDRGVLLGTAHPGLVGVSVLVVVASCVALWAVLPVLPMAAADRLGASFILALLNAYFFLASAARVVGTPDGFVEMDGLFLIRRVKVAAIDSVLTESALQLRMVSGRLVRTAAYLPSPGGQMLGHPSSRRAAERIEIFRSRWGTVSSPANSGATDYTVLLRTRALWGAACLVGVLFGGALAIELL